MNVPTQPGRALFALIEGGHFDSPESEPCPPDIMHRLECEAHEAEERRAWEDFLADAFAAAHP